MPPFQDLIQWTAESASLPSPTRWVGGAMALAAVGWALSIWQARLWNRSFRPRPRHQLACLAAAAVVLVASLAVPLLSAGLRVTDRVGVELDAAWSRVAPPSGARADRVDSALAGLADEAPWAADAVALALQAGHPTASHAYAAVRSRTLERADSTLGTARAAAVVAALLAQALAAGVVAVSAHRRVLVHV